MATLRRSSPIGIGCMRRSSSPIISLRYFISTSTRRCWKSSCDEIVAAPSIGWNPFGGGMVTTGLRMSDSNAIGGGLGKFGSADPAGETLIGGSTLGGTATGLVEGVTVGASFLPGGIGGMLMFLSVPILGSCGNGGTGGGAADSSPPGICGSTFCRLSIDSFSLFSNSPVGMSGGGSLSLGAATGGVIGGSLSLPTTIGGNGACPGSNWKWTVLLGPTGVASLDVAEAISSGVITCRALASLVQRSTPSTPMLTRPKMQTMPAHRLVFMGCVLVAGECKSVFA